ALRNSGGWAAARWFSPSTSPRRRRRRRSRPRQPPAAPSGRLLSRPNSRPASRWGSSRGPHAPGRPATNTANPTPPGAVCPIARRKNPRSDLTRRARSRTGGAAPADGCGLTPPAGSHLRLQVVLKAELLDQADLRLQPVDRSEERRVGNER